MSPVGHLFEDDRQQGAPYCLFIEHGGDTLEIRFRDLWEFVGRVSVIREEAGAFELRLGEPGHYAEIAEDYHGR